MECLLLSKAFIAARVSLYPFILLELLGSSTSFFSFHLIMVSPVTDPLPKPTLSWSNHVKLPFSLHIHGHFCPMRFSSSSFLVVCVPRAARRKPRPWCRMTLMHYWICAEVKCHVHLWAGLSYLESISHTHAHCVRMTDWRKKKPKNICWRSKDAVF